MAEETILLDVKLDSQKALKSIEALQEEMRLLAKTQKDLDDAYKSHTITEAEYASAMDSNKVRIGEVKKEMKGLFAQMRENNTELKTHTGSLNEERAALNNMLKAYDSLSAAERDNEEIGGALLKNIQAQTDKVKGLEEATGRHQRNVGNYPAAVAPAINVLNKMGVSLDSLAAHGVKSFAAMGQGAKAFGKTLLTPPVGLIVVVLSAIMLVIQKLSEAFKKNDNAGTDLAVAFSALKPIGEAIRFVFDGLAKILGSLAKGIANTITAIAGAAEALLGIENGYSKAAKAAAELVIAEDNLQEAERQYTINAAKRAKEVSELRAKATEEQDPKKRKALLKDAIALEEQDLQDRKDIAAEKLRILEKTAKQEKDTSDATKDAIANARAEMLRAEQEYYDGTRRLRSQLVAAEKEQAAAEKKAADERRARYKEYLQQLKEQAKTKQDIEDKAADLAISIITDEGERAIAQRKIQGEREIRALKQQLEDDKTLTKESRKELNQLIIDMQTALEVELRQMADEQFEADLEAERAQQERITQLKIDMAEEDSEEWIELQKELLNLQLEAELEAVELSEEEKFLIRSKYQQMTDEMEEKATKRRTKAEEDIAKKAADELEKEKKKYEDAMWGMAESVSGAFGAMSDLLEAWGEENANASKAAKAFAFMTILADEAQSIAKGALAMIEAVEGATKAAAATGPAAPFTLAAYIGEMVGIVAGMIASTASTIAQAKQIFGQADAAEANAGSFAGGGIIGGTSYEGDRLQANVNSGEMIINREQQSRLFDIANGGALGGFSYDTMAAAMASAVAAQPAPVLAFSEFAKADQKLTTYKNIARL